MWLEDRLQTHSGFVFSELQLQYDKTCKSSAGAVAANVLIDVLVI